MRKDQRKKANRGDAKSQIRSLRSTVIYTDATSQEKRREEVRGRKSVQVREQCDAPEGQWKIRLELLKELGELLNSRSSALVAT